jgi:hypothetical protein
MVTLRIIGFLNLVHHTEFKITRKCNVLETGSGPVIEIKENNTKKYYVFLHSMHS